MACAKILVESRADLKAKNKRKFTPIDEAKKNKNFQLVEYLQQKWNEREVY